MQFYKSLFGWYSFHLHSENVFERFVSIDYQLFRWKFFFWKHLCHRLPMTRRIWKKKHRKPPTKKLWAFISTFAMPLNIAEEKIGNKKFVEHTRTFSYRGKCLIVYTILPMFVKKRLTHSLQLEKKMSPKTYFQTWIICTVLTYLKCAFDMSTLTPKRHHFWNVLIHLAENTNVKSQVKLDLPCRI